MIRTIRRTLVTGVLAGVAMLGAAASASIVPAVQSITSEDGNFRWTYSVGVIDFDLRVEREDFFTIYDFRGYVPGSAQQPDGWVFSAQNVGLTPDGTVPTDHPGIVNLTWERVGETIGDDAVVDLGEFSAVSSLQGVAFGDFTSQATLSVGDAEGTKVSRIGTTGVPIPLPASALMFPLGAAVAGLCYRRMRRQGC